MHFSSETRLCELEAAFPSMKGQFVSGGDFFSGENADLTLSQLHDRHPTWAVDDMLLGLTNLERATECGAQTVWPLTNASMIYLPAIKKQRRRYAVLLAGGAYGAVCTIVESMPVAARLNALGIDCFCLNYRTATPQCFVSGLMPQPLDDLAEALRLIGKKQDVFGVEPVHYLLAGFSAGGHLASLWGTASLGARHYGLPQPELLALVYPLITMEHFPDGPAKQYMCSGLFGAGYPPQILRQYDASSNLDAQYPKTMLVRALDDTTVPKENSDYLLRALCEHHIPHRLRQAETGEHGFGLGSQTPLRGWVDKAVTFWEENS